MVALCIAAMPAWIAMKQWLENFAYRTAISWWLFLVSVGIILVVAILTAGWNTFKAAGRNPVEALRYE
jgi:putative ABC transport system permease protein